MVGCFLVPHFPLACELAQRPHLKGLPAAVTAADGTVWATSAAAARQGVAAGMPIREALGLCPGLAVIEGRPLRCREIFQEVLAALSRVAFTVEPGGEGTAYLGLDELLGYRQEPQSAIRTLLSCAPAALEPRLGIAPGRFPARVAAAAAGPGQCLKVEASLLQAFLAPQPVDTLPLSTETLRRLRLLRLNRLGEVAELPRAALAAQFGPEGALAWDLASGAPEPALFPRSRSLAVEEKLILDPPLISRQALIAAFSQTLGRTLRQPAMHGLAARQARLRASTERRASWEREVIFKEALSERDPIWAALTSPLAEACLPGPVSEIGLELAGLIRAEGRQLALPSQRGRVKERLEESLRQLKLRYGYCPVGKVVEIEPWSRIPERRLGLIDFDP